MKLDIGPYSNVFLVKSNNYELFDVIKNISCKQILYDQLHSNFEWERAILLQIDHPFII